MELVQSDLLRGKENITTLSACKCISLIAQTSSKMRESAIPLKSYKWMIQQQEWPLHMHGSEVCLSVLYHMITWCLNWRTQLSRKITFPLAKTDVVKLLELFWPRTKLPLNWRKPENKGLCKTRMRTADGGRRTKEKKKNNKKKKMTIIKNDIKWYHVKCCKAS